MLKDKTKSLSRYHLKIQSKAERVNIEGLSDIYNEIKNREIKEFKVIQLKDIGKKFSSTRKFVEIIEEMLLDYYSGVVQFLTKWEEPAPKIVEKIKSKKSRNRS
ncbi:MAG: hypothetical protein U5N58_13925 [Actinomycetota bacterium]|nr:hypothetical protein [Actinomycetota bacterium]